jgi:hypothetical protein
VGVLHVQCSIRRADVQIKPGAAPTRRPGACMHTPRLDRIPVTRLGFPRPNEPDGASSAMRQLNSVGLRSAMQHNVSVMNQTTVSTSAGLATSEKPSTASLRLCIACSNRFPLASDIEFGTKSHVAAGLTYQPFASTCANCRAPDLFLSQ